MAAEHATPALRVTGLHHRYGTEPVLTDMHLSVAAGEIHALLGANGAGKSTLIKAISGVLRPERGIIEVDGRPCRFRSARDARAAGVQTVQQDLGLVGGLNAVDNLFLGRPMPRRGTLPGLRGSPARGLLLDRRAARHTARAWLASVGPEVPLDRPVAQLSPVQQTCVALARAMSAHARVLILDEPTAALTDQETTVLFGLLRRLRAGGTAIVYVTHRLHEVFELADRITVLRDRRAVATVAPAETDADELVRLMANAGTPRPTAALARPAAGPVVLNVDGLSGNRVRDVSITLRAGEVVGIAGIAGSGRSELLRLVAGAQRPRSGTVRRDGRPVRPGSTRTALAAGIALVPEDRLRQAVLPDADVTDNLVLASLAQLSSGGIRRRARERAAYRSLAEQLDIRASSPRQPAWQLSGGNQQKLILGRVLHRDPAVLLLDEPTRGVDVRTKHAIRELVARVAATAGVIVVTSELDELIALADRLLVLREGRLVAELDAATADERSILRHCYGGTPA
ncbi:sugar ABC transporter ATP-binding protein [Actinoplanes sp. NPDC023801]|uniref:sugar ABC transporter ATP-binding protein n=1 Tax=Actinoplanes sp. NPDC023801 TaxID=3154595 RepID=UPI0033E551DD